jgi:hypothetical protein
MLRVDAPLTNGEGTLVTARSATGSMNDHERRVEFLLGLR